MTQPIDPQVLEALKAALPMLKEQVKAEMVVEVLSARQPDAPPLRQVAAEWTRVVLDAPETSDLSRGDARMSRGHLRLILDLDFEFESPWSRRDESGRQLCRIGDVPANRVNSLVVKALYRRLLVLPQRRWTTGTDGTRSLVDVPGKTLSPGYRKRIVGTLRALLKYKFGEFTPLVRFRSGERAGKRHGAFEGEAHLREFLAHVPGWIRQLALLAVDRGCMRLSEVLYLEKREVNLAAGRITLPAHRTKNGVERSFPISAANREMLTAQMAASQSPVLVFCRPNGKRWSTRWVQELIKQAGEKSGIKLGKHHNERPTFHYLRRTAVTWRLFIDRDVKAAQEEGGWLDMQTMSGYLELTDAMVEESAANANASVDAKRAAMRAAADRRPPVQAPAPASAPAYRPARRSPRSGG